MTYNVLDSSCWIEYFNGSTVGEQFADLIEDSDSVIVPTICLAEVYRHALRHRSDEEALSIVGGMIVSPLAELDGDLAPFAVRLGAEHALPLADSIIYATARGYQATLWTLDSDFEGLPGVEYIAR